jgi:hypothetical protein
MKLNKTLLIITICFLIINFLFFKHSETLNGGRAMIYIIIIPLFWIITLITVGILAYKKRKKWFGREMKFSTIALLILCSPLSIWGFSTITRPEIQLSSTGYNPINGITIKTETWDYNSGQTAIRKFWKLDKENWTNSEENEYKRDSIWVYFDKKGDTLKVEKYKNDELIQTTELKK